MFFFFYKGVRMKDLAKDAKKVIWCASITYIQ